MEECPISRSLWQLEETGIQIPPGEKGHYLIKDELAKNKGEQVWAFPLLSSDDLYDEEEYGEMLQKAAEEVLGNSIEIP